MTDPAFADILAANARYAQQFHLGLKRPEAAKGLAVLADHLAQRGQRTLQFPADLAVLSKQQDLHATTVRWP